MDYFRLNREQVFLQLNKTQVAPKENIWFSAYVYDLRTNTPSLQTTNLHVALLNSKGEQLVYKTLFIHGGVGGNWFKLPKKDFKPGRYFIKASTQYMRNFKEDLSFVQSFEILGAESTATTQPQAYDLQFLPEGGHLVSEINNVVGVKLIDEQGKGVSFEKAELHSENGKTIARFSANQFGMGKFNITPKISEKYSVKITLSDGQTIENSLPKAELRGLILKTNNFLEDQVIFSLETNQYTLPNVKNKKFYITYHQQHRFKGVQVTFPENTTKIPVTFERDYLFPGTNIVTIFDEEEQPILERLIFNPIDIQRKSVSARVTKNLVDSVAIEIRNSGKIDSLQHLSISVLPKRTKAYRPQHDILSAFLLKPYLKYPIENGSYYFNHSDKRERLYNLDILLLTQGWSKYDWKNSTHSKPKELFPPEVGFSLSGSINNLKDDQTKLFVASPENRLLELIKIRKTQKFELEHLFIKDSSNVNLGLFNKTSEGIVKANYAFTLLPFKKELVLNTEQRNANTFSPAQNSTLLNADQFIQNATALDTVHLKGKKKEAEKEKNIFFDDFTPITDEMRNQFQYITDYIATKNFNVVRSPTGYISIKSRRSATIFGSTDTMVILDGLPLEDDMDMLSHLLISQVKNIRIDQTGHGYGIFGANGVIEINTRTDYSNHHASKNNLYSFTTRNGFARNKEFYIPKYTSYTSDLFRDYGAIHWEPDLTIDKQHGSVSFKIPNTLTKNIRLFIEGMTTDGKLTSEEINLQTR